MAWLTLSRTSCAIFHQVMREIDAGSHRAIAVIAGAFVEDHLTDFLRSRLARDDSMQKGMFSPGRALGYFGIKNNLAYLMGLYSKDAWKELDTIRYNRNEFAHRVDIHTFVLQSIKDRCDHLVLWEGSKLKRRGKLAEANW